MPVIQGNFKGGRPGSLTVPTTLRLSPGQGQPLPPAVQQKMEGLLGASLSGVRVRVGPEAAAIGALAFTTGSDIYFAPGQYSPHTVHGQRLLGHELTHVLQQRAGRVRQTTPGLAIVHDPALEAEAERMGVRVGTAIQPRMATAGTPPAATPPRYMIHSPMPGPDGRMQIRASAPGATGAAGSVNIQRTAAGMLEITDLRVAPEHRKRGVGKQLVKAALNAVQRQRLKGAVLEAHPGDAGMTAQRLVSMYQHLGFTSVGLSSRGRPLMQYHAGSAIVQPKMRPGGVIQRSAAAKPTGEVKKAMEFTGGFRMVGHSGVSMPSGGMSTFATLEVGLGSGDPDEDTDEAEMIVLGASKNVTSKKKHAEDVVIGILAANSGMLGAATTSIRINVTKSPCSSKHGTSNKAKGCTESLIEFAAQKLADGSTPKYSLTVWASKLYGNTTAMKKNSCKAMQDMKAAGISVALGEARISVPDGDCKL